MDVIVSVIVLFSGTEGKYMPQDKGQKKKSLYVLLKTKVMYWKYFHFRYNLHETSCERSLGGIWILEKYGKGLAYRAQVFGENGHRKRVVSKTLSRVKIFENAQGAYDFFCLLDLLLLFL